MIWIDLAAAAKNGERRLRRHTAAPAQFGIIVRRRGIRIIGRPPRGRRSVECPGSNQNYVGACTK